MKTIKLKKLFTKKVYLNTDILIFNLYYENKYKGKN